MSRLTTAQVSDLLARQSQAIDDGDAAGWADTYTPDGSFTSPTYGDPVVGRDALIRFAERVHADLRADGIQQRHWLNNVVVDADALRARSYMMIVRTDASGEPTILRHLTTTDEFAFGDDGTLRMRSRLVMRDA